MRQNIFKNRQVYIEKDAKINYERFKVKNYGKRNGRNPNGTEPGAQRFSGNYGTAFANTKAKNFQKNYEIDGDNSIRRKDSHEFDTTIWQLQKQDMQQIDPKKSGQISMQNSNQDPWSDQRRKASA